jgi:hypothetical protein
VAGLPGGLPAGPLKGHCGALTCLGCDTHQTVALDIVRPADDDADPPMRWGQSGPAR